MRLIGLAVVTSLMLLGCAESSPASDADLAPGVTYEFVWSEEGAVAYSDGSWSVTSGLGYDVTVSLGLLTISTVQLIPCDDVTASAAEPWGLRWFDWLLGARSARAGHGATQTDQSAVLDEEIEVLDPSGNVALGPAPFESHDYCGLHVLFGPSVNETPDVVIGGYQTSDSAIDMYLHVLHMEGTWRRGEGAAESFLVHTALPAGSLVDLEAEDGAALRIPTGAWAARVQVERELGSLFDDVDFETASEETRDKAMLTALVDGLDARVVILALEQPNP